MRETIRTRRQSGRRGSAAVTFGRFEGDSLALRAERPMLEQVLGSVVAPERAGARVSTAMHPADQMYTYAVQRLHSEELARSQYLAVGANELSAVRQIIRWAFGSPERVSAFLDFASGFGRLTRFLTLDLPPERIWVSDIQEAAVAFQQEQFGVHGLLSTTKPEDLTCETRFDCIFVASLFSHLPETTFARWLAKLYSMLSVDGVLCFSVHDASLLPRTETMPEGGHWYRAGSEIDSLDTSDYGTAFVTEAFVARAIQAASDGHASYCRLKRALGYLQDYYVVCRRPDQDFSRLKFRHGPWGVIDKMQRLEGKGLYISGWATDSTPGQSVKEIQVFLNGVLVQRCTPSILRPKLLPIFPMSGWECAIPIPMPRRTAEDALTVTVLSTSGEECLLYFGELEWLQPGQV